MKYVADESPHIKEGWDVRLDGKLIAETRPPGAEQSAKAIADALNARLDLAEAYAFRHLFGRIVNEHEWWQPGNNMGDPETREWLPNGHDHLAPLMQRESRATCRRCKFERLVAVYLEGNPKGIASI
jgi:hypothetical protein